MFALKIKNNKTINTYLNLIYRLLITFKDIEDDKKEEESIKKESNNLSSTNDNNNISTIKNR